MLGVRNFQSPPALEASRAKIKRFAHNSAVLRNFNVRVWEQSSAYCQYVFQSRQGVERPTGFFVNTHFPVKAVAKDCASDNLSWETCWWDWKNSWKINYAVTGEGPPVILVHGFGASLGQFRKNIPAIAETGFRVYAVDLLGFGRSSKPVDLNFTMQVWCDQLSDFVREVVQPAHAGEGVVLVGNSIGSLAALMANAALPEGTVRGTALLNCAAGMNNKAVQGDWRVRLALPLFYLIDILLKSRLGRVIFERVRQRESLRSALRGVYATAESVDDELVDLFHEPSCDEGAAEVFISIYTGNEAGPTPPEVVPLVRGPLLVLWGEEDRLTPRSGPVGRLFEALPATRPGTDFVALPACGHCPHDDRPDLVHEKLLPWMKALPAAEQPAA